MNRAETTCARLNEELDSSPQMSSVKRVRTYGVASGHGGIGARLTQAITRRRMLSATRGRPSLFTWAEARR